MHILMRIQSMITNVCFMHHEIYSCQKKIKNISYFRQLKGPFAFVKRSISHRTSLLLLVLPNCAFFAQRTFQNSH